MKKTNNCYLFFWVPTMATSWPVLSLPPPNIRSIKCAHNHLITHCYHSLNPKYSKINMSGGRKLKSKTWKKILKKGCIKKRSWYQKSIHIATWFPKENEGHYSVGKIFGSSQAKKWRNKCISNKAAMINFNLLEVNSHFHSRWKDHSTCHCWR